MSAPTLHATQATPAFTAALGAGDLREATRIAYAVLFPSLGEVEKALDLLEPLLAASFDFGLLEAIYVAFGRAVTTSLDSLQALDMVGYVAHHGRGAPYERVRFPSPELAAAVSHAEIALRGYAEAMATYHRRARADAERARVTIHFLAEGWKSFDGSRESAAQFDERVPIAVDSFGDIVRTFGVAAATLALRPG